MALPEEKTNSTPDWLTAGSTRIDKPVTQIRGGGIFIPSKRTPQEEAEESRKTRGAEIDEERLDITKRGEQREIEEKTFDRGTKLYDQFVGRTAVKNYEQAWPAFTSALSQPATTSGDRVLIYNAIKILDPEGAVPTGDIEGIQSQSPILQRIARDFGRLIDSGGTLPAQQRAELKEALEARVKTLRSPYELIRKDFERRSQNLNLDPLDTIGSRIDEADADIYQNYLQSLEAPAQGGGAVPVLKVAEGDRFATDKDIENASLMQGAWQSGKSIDELQALAKSLKIDPLSPETIKELQNDPKRTIIWTPARSGIREGLNQAWVWVQLSVLVQYEDLLVTLPKKHCLW